MRGKSVRAAAAAIMVAAASSAWVVAPAEAETTGPSSASHVRGHSLKTWERLWFDWILTDKANPLFNGGCGTVVDGVYFLPAAGIPNANLECTIPKNTPVLLTPVGAFSEEPTWGSTDAAVLADAKVTFEQHTSASLSVDGHRVSLKNTRVNAGVYNIGPVEAGSYYDVVCEELVDPCVKDWDAGDTVRLATIGKFVILDPLSPGTHVIEATGTYPWAVYKLTATLHVARHS